MIDLALMCSPTPSPLAALASEYSTTPPLGLAYMAAVLRGKGYRVDVVDMNLRCCTPAYLRRFLAVRRPRMVGISALTESYPNAVRIANIVKEFSQEVTMVVGGPHVTFTAEEALTHGCFDFVVCREGEITLLELANCLLRGEGHLEEISGLCWRRGEEIFRTSPRPPIEDLDALPSPARSLLFLEKYRHAGALITGRGCPGGCIFCSARAMSGGRYRRRCLEEVMAELCMLRRMGVTSLVFLDDSLTADLNRLDRLLFRMEREKIVMPWVCESRVDIEDASFFQKMADAGCTGVQFGVESGSERILAGLGKGTSRQQVISAVEGATRAGIGPMCSFMIGLPQDTMETAMETIRFAEELQREFYVQAGISIATPFPGTPMFRKAQELGLTIRETDYSFFNLYTPVMETEHLSRDEIRALHFESVARLRRAARPGMWTLFPPPPDLRETEVYDFRRYLY